MENDLKEIIRYFECLLLDYKGLKKENNEQLKIIDILASDLEEYVYEHKLTKEQIIAEAKERGEKNE